MQKNVPVNKQIFVGKVLDRILKTGRLSAECKFSPDFKKTWSDLHIQHITKLGILGVHI